MNATLKTLSAMHATHGNFKDDPVPQEILNAIVQASLRAPNSSNRQAYSLIVLDNSERIFDLLECRAPHAIVFCADYNRVKDLGEHAGHPIRGDNFADYLSIHTDAALAAQTAAIAATSLGVNTLFTNSLLFLDRRDINKLYQALSLPEENCVPVIALLLGYETEPPKYRTSRFDGPGIVHYNRYKRLTDTEIKELLKKQNDSKNHFFVSPKTRKFTDYYYGKWLKPAREKDVLENDLNLYGVFKKAGFFRFF